MGTASTKQNVKPHDVLTQEVSTEDTVLSVLKAQGELLAQQQKQMQTMLELMQGCSFQGNVTQRPYMRRNTKLRRCWTCNSTEHLQAKCPQKKKPQLASADETQPGN